MGNKRIGGQISDYIKLRIKKGRTQVHLLNCYMGGNFGAPWLGEGVGCGPAWERKGGGGATLKNN